jgi:hypothetical protein
MRGDRACILARCVVSSYAWKAIRDDRLGGSVRRLWPVFGGLAVCATVVVLGVAVPAQARPVHNPKPCDATGSLFCVTAAAFSNVTASNPARPDGKRWTWVEWSLENASRSSIEHPTITVSLSDVCGADACSALSSAFVLPAAPDVCAPSGSALVCSYPKLAAGASTDTTRIYFKTADAPATSTVIDVTAEVKKKKWAHDTASTAVVVAYEPDASAAASFALDGKPLHLAANDELSSFDFTSASAAPFLARLQVEEPSPIYCFGDVPCFDRTLVASTEQAAGFSAANPVVFYARLVDPPHGISEKTLSAVHFYDPVTLQANAASKRFTGPAGTSFARIDGVTFDAGVSAVIAAGTYFVIDYRAADGSFKLAAKKWGPPVKPLSSAPVTGGPIRVIGDQKDERSTTSCTTAPAAIDFPVPSICVLKLKVNGHKALDNWVWDASNGRIGW